MIKMTNEEIRELIGIERLKKDAMGMRSSPPRYFERDSVKKYLEVESAEPIEGGMFKIVEINPRLGRRVTILKPRGNDYDRVYELLLDKEHFDF
ncbi:MAG: hypothetical protein KKG75_03075 [Nanoarchaeota archaeon]|nr:hypothetical protein [Nanoarchaeota archaeon]